MAPNENVAKTSPSLPLLQKTLQSLATASVVLHGFAHRNKNQHRGTRWWGPFSMLSRSLRKLLVDLEGAVQRLEVLSNQSLSRAKRKKDGPNVRQPELDKFTQRVQWVHEVIVAKAYESFTQLATDKQFAQLGLVLIGVLAQVEDAIAPFVQDAMEDEAAEDAAASKPAEMIPHTIKLPGATPSFNSFDTSGSDLDLGVAISRDELHPGEDGEEPKATIEHTKKRKKPALLKEPEQDVKESEDKDWSRKKAKTSVDPTRPHTDRNTKPAEPKNVTKVKKKKKKGGDEFDDLFSSLL